MFLASLTLLMLDYALTYASGVSDAVDLCCANCMILEGAYTVHDCFSCHRLSWLLLEELYLFKCACNGKLCASVLNCPQESCDFEICSLFCHSEQARISNGLSPIRNCECSDLLLSVCDVQFCPMCAFSEGSPWIALRYGRIRWKLLDLLIN